MNTNVNLAAPVGVMAFLGTGFLFFIVALALIQSLIVKKPGRARVVLFAMLIIAGAYLAAIVILSFASQERVLARGAEKHFCEIDCHLAYSVVNTRQTQTLGDPPNQETAQGVYTIITIKTRFDETTISPRRGNGLLYPNSRVLTVIDERGNKYVPAGGDKRAFSTVQTKSTPMATPLRPGESYTTDVIFDLPPEVKSATLVINEGEWLTHFIIGHENSLLHKKTRFQLDLPATLLAGSDRYLQLWETTLSRARCEQHQSVGHSQLIQSPGRDGSAFQTNRAAARVGEEISRRG